MLYYRLYFMHRFSGHVIFRFELAVMIDVTAEAVHEIEAVIKHRHNPPAVEIRYTTCRQCRRVRGLAQRACSSPVKWPRKA